MVLTWCWRGADVVQVTAACPENTADAEYYEASPPSATSDRVCVVAAVCDGDTQYECKALGQASDRECCALTVCAANSAWIATKKTPTTDQVCKPHTVCGAREYMSARGTLDEDTQCKAITDCSGLEPRHFEVVKATATSDTACQEAAVCQAGFREVTAPQTGQDTQCRACDGRDSYQDEEGQAACKRVTKCGKGEYMAVLPTPTSDGVRSGTRSERAAPQRQHSSKTAVAPKWGHIS